MIIEKSPERLSTDDIARQAYEAAAKRIEQLEGNEIYERAWRRACEAIREMARSI